MSTSALDSRLSHLLSETLESVRQRQRDTFGQVLGGLDRPFALFGAGNLGRKALPVLLGMGHVPVAFIDNNPALWGRFIDGVEIMSPQQLAERSTGDLPGLITTIWCGEADDRMIDRLTPLHALGFSRIALFGHLAWCFPESFLPHYSLDLPEKLLAQAPQVREAFAMLGDEPSRQLYVDHVEWRLFLDYDLLPAASLLPIYFNDHYINDRADEVLYDIGAFSGDSVLGYVESGRSYREIHSFEPSANNYKVLEACLSKLSRHQSGLFAHPLAIGDSVGTVLIEDDNGPASRVGQGSEVVNMTTLDELSKVIAPATFIKIDIEGFEPQCLAGGRQLIAEHHPAIAVCVYHLQDHLWSILLQLQGYYPGYRFSLCPHLAEGWDLVLYAVPADRLVS